MGARTELLDTALANCRWRRRKMDEILVVGTAIADNYALSADMPPTIALLAGAARDVLMPADATTPRGLRLTIVNLGVTTGAVITLKTSADAALAPAVTIPINAAVTMIFLGGTGTQGWRRVDQ